MGPHSKISRQLQPLVLGSMEDKISVRAFIAIPLSEEINLEIENLLHPFKESGWDVKWTRKDQRHLTLRFLGNTRFEEIEKIKSLLESLFHPAESFDVRLGKLGAFPNLKEPKVLWIGVEEGAAALIDLEMKLSQALDRLGLSKEGRPFTPHITVGRVRSNQNKFRCEGYLKNDTSLGVGSMTVSKVVFFKSTLTKDGPLYEILHIAPLKPRQQT